PPVCVKAVHIFHCTYAIFIAGNGSEINGLGLPVFKCPVKRPLGQGNQGWVHGFSVHGKGGQSLYGKCRKEKTAFFYKSSPVVHFSTSWLWFLLVQNFYNPVDQLPQAAG